MNIEKLAQLRLRYKFTENDLLNEIQNIKINGVTEVEFEALNRPDELKQYVLKEQLTSSGRSPVIPAKMSPVERQEKIRQIQEKKEERVVQKLSKRENHLEEVLEKCETVAQLKEQKALETKVKFGEKMLKVNEHLERVRRAQEEAIQQKQRRLQLKDEIERTKQVSVELKKRQNVIERTFERDIKIEQVLTKKQEILEVEAERAVSRHEKQGFQQMDVRSRSKVQDSAKKLDIVLDQNIQKAVEQKKRQLEQIKLQSQEKLKKIQEVKEKKQKLVELEQFEKCVKIASRSSSRKDRSESTNKK